MTNLNLDEAIELDDKTMFKSPDPFGANDKLWMHKRDLLKAVIPILNDLYIQFEYDIDAPKSLENGLVDLIENLLHQDRIALLERIDRALEEDVEYGGQLIIQEEDWNKLKKDLIED